MLIERFPLLNIPAAGFFDIKPYLTCLPTVLKLILVKKSVKKPMEELLYDSELQKGFLFSAPPSCSQSVK
jgi:hypothetical protein